MSALQLECPSLLAYKYEGCAIVHNELKINKDTLVTYCSTVSPFGRCTEKLYFVMNDTEFVSFYRFAAF